MLQYTTIFFVFIILLNLLNFITCQCDTEIIKNNQGSVTYEPTEILSMQGQTYYINSYHMIILDQIQNTIKINLGNTYLITGIGIQISTTLQSNKCKEERNINLNEYSFFAFNNNQRFSINVNRNNEFQNLNITTQMSIRKITFKPIKASIIEITRHLVTDTNSHCMRYEVYGCITTTEPTCEYILQYDLTQPVNIINGSDVIGNTYRGVCDGKWCSGGVGLLTDGYFDKFYSWSTTTTSIMLSFIFYEALFIRSITIYSNISITPIAYIYCINYTDSTTTNNINYIKSTINNINIVTDNIQLLINVNNQISISEIEFRTNTGNILRREQPIEMCLPINFQDQTINIIISVIVPSILCFAIGSICTAIIIKICSYCCSEVTVASKMENTKLNKISQNRQKSQTVYTEAHPSGMVLDEDIKYSQDPGNQYISNSQENLLNNDNIKINVNNSTSNDIDDEFRNKAVSIITQSENPQYVSSKVQKYYTNQPKSVSFKEDNNNNNNNNILFEDNNLYSKNEENSGYDQLNFQGRQETL